MNIKTLRGAAIAGLAAIPLLLAISRALGLYSVISDLVGVVL